MPDTDPIVSLREVDESNFKSILDLKLAEGQTQFIASNEKTLKQAAEVSEAWLRAIYAGDDLVELVLLHDEHLRESPRETGYYFLWRILIDADYQGKGYGKAAIAEVINYVKTRPHAKRLLSSYLPGEGGPEGFYQRFGFTPTGNKIDEDIEIELPLL